MGFHVSIDGNAERLLRHLRSDPAEIFDRPYKGYLLFLTGAADQETCDWLAKNAVVLDSLTGEDIAFAVFARTFRMTLHTAWSTVSRPRQCIGEIPSEEIKDGSWQVDRIVKSGRCGWVVDGDEIVAVTYAVDEIAKAFHVLGDLPCVLVLDAIPSERINIIRLSEQIRECFVELLRKSLTKFSAMPGYAQVEGRVQDILDLHHAIERTAALRPALERKLRSLREGLKHAEFVGPVDHPVRGDVGSRLKEAQEALCRPSLRDFRKALTGSRQKSKAREYDPIPGLDRQTLSEIAGHAESLYPRLRSLVTAIDSLNAARRAAQPERSQRLATITGRHVAQLLPARHIPPVENIQDLDVDEIISDLQSERECIISTIMTRIPSEEVLLLNLERFKHDRYLHRIERTRKKIGDLEDRLRAIAEDPQRATRDATQRYTVALEAYSASNPASLWEAMSQTLREMRLSAFSANVKTTVASIAAGVFRPDFLLKLWQG